MKELSQANTFNFLQFDHRVSNCKLAQFSIFVFSRFRGSELGVDADSRECL